MLIKNSIVAGKILTFLEASGRAIFLEELAYYIKEPVHIIQLGVERLVREGLAILDIENSTIRPVYPSTLEEGKDCCNQNYLKTYVFT